MDKEYDNIVGAIDGIEDGAVIAIGGFFSAGVPRTLLQALAESKVSNLTLACGAGPLVGFKEIAKTLAENKQLKKIIDSYALPRSISLGKNDIIEQKIRAGEIELEIFPMGTLAEKYRAAGAGIPAFFTPTGMGTKVAEGQISNDQKDSVVKETRKFNNQDCVLEEALKCDFAFVHAYKADLEGNLQYRKTAHNFNHIMATAATVTVAEVENIVEPGEIEPGMIHTPGIYVQRVVKVPRLSYTCTID